MPVNINPIFALMKKLLNVGITLPTNAVVIKNKVYRRKSRRNVGVILLKLGLKEIFCEKSR